jgi:Na+/H+ antiporter NhaD/arsenite permease-like protein
VLTGAWVVWGDDRAQFVLIGSLLRTGIPQDLFTQLISAFGQDIVRLWFVMALLYAVIFASNILTNVPIILLLAPLINCLPCPAEYGFEVSTPSCLDDLGLPIINNGTCIYPCEESRLYPRPVCPAYLTEASRYENYTAFIGWVIIAWAATIAGNLTLVGSAANLIVDSRARTVGAPELKFFYYLPFGFVTTLVFSFIGLLLILLVVGGL